MRVASLVVVSVIVAGAIVLVAQGTPEQVAAGRKLYNSKKCMQCHTIEGRGGTLTKQFALDGVGAETSAADIKKWLTNPEEMEATKKPVKLKMSSKKVPLTDAEADAITAYMLTLTKPPKGK